MNALDFRRAAERAIVACLWSAVVLGSAVLALTAPVYTSAMTQALDVPQSAGLPAVDVVHLSAQVRALVADPEFDQLPTKWRGQPAFDGAAVSHLMDVRSVFSAARVAVGVLALVLAAYVGWCVARRRIDELTSGMAWGAWLLAGATVLAVVVAVTSFDVLFTAFHGIFFAAGTWTFPQDSLLIRLFPERFWMVSGGVWAALNLFGATVLGVGSRLLRGNLARRNASRSENYV